MMSGCNVIHVTSDEKWQTNWRWVPRVHRWTTSRQNREGECHTICQKETSEKEGCNPFDYQSGTDSTLGDSIWTLWTKIHCGRDDANPLKVTRKRLCRCLDGPMSRKRSVRSRDWVSKSTFPYQYQYFYWVYKTNTFTEYTKRSIQKDISTEYPKAHFHISIDVFPPPHVRPSLTHTYPSNTTIGSGVSLGKKFFNQHNLLDWTTLNLSDNIQTWMFFHRLISIFFHLMSDGLLTHTYNYTSNTTIVARVRKKFFSLHRLLHWTTKFECQ